MLTSKEFRVKGKFRLKDVDANRNKPYKNREEAEEELQELLKELRELQEIFYADNRFGLLISLQAMDTGGKDGLIRCVMDAFNPLGCHVTSFRSPSAVEQDHDYLWRHHLAMPARGEIAIHNRSHYENVLVVRVHNFVPKPVWQQYYDQINAFERNLTELRTVVVKIYLHISKDEQKERLQARLDDPKKLWKFSLGDLAERKHWDEYMDAYQDALTRCSTEHAPWYVIPANRKWFRNVAVARVLVDTLKGLDLKYPAPTVKDPKKIRIV